MGAHWSLFTEISFLACSLFRTHQNNVEKPTGPKRTGGRSYGNSVGNKGSQNCFFYKEREEARKRILATPARLPPFLAPSPPPLAPLPLAPPPPSQASLVLYVYVHLHHQNRTLPLEKASLGVRSYRYIKRVLVFFTTR